MMAKQAVKRAGGKWSRQFAINLPPEEKADTEKFMTAEYPIFGERNYKNMLGRKALILYKEMVRKHGMDPRTLLPNNPQ